MSKPDRTADRARKAFAHYAGAAMDARAEHKAARAVKRAERRERWARREYLDSLRLSDLLAEV
jgi:hypothetical protein